VEAEALKRENKKVEGAAKVERVEKEQGRSSVNDSTSSKRSKTPPAPGDKKAVKKQQPPTQDAGSLQSGAPSCAGKRSRPGETQAARKSSHMPLSELVMRAVENLCKGKPAGFRVTRSEIKAKVHLPVSSCCHPHLRDLHAFVLW